MITLKSREEVEKLRSANRIVAEVMAPHQPLTLLLILAHQGILKQLLKLPHPSTFLALKFFFHNKIL